MAVAALQPQTSAFSVFRNRNFSVLWVGQLVSTIGDSLMSLAASIMIYRLTGSALSVGLMLMATVAPSIVIGLVAGVFVDRFDRRKIMISADIIRALLVLSIPFLVPLNIAWLYVIVLLTSCVSQFFEPAHASVIPDVATDEELSAANSLLAISSFGSTAVGFAASGLIASQFSISWAFYLDALSFLFSAACIYFLRLAPTQTPDKTGVKTVLTNLRSGLTTLWNTPILRSAFILGPVVAVSFGMWNTLLLPYARQVLGATEFEYGLQEGMTSIGFVVGSLLMARISGVFHEGQWLAISFLLMGILGIVYASLASVPLAILIVTFSGFSNAPSAIARQLIIQRNTPRAVRGRVNSAFFVTRDTAFLIGMAAAGLADVVGARDMILVSAVLIIVPGAMALLLPGLRQPAAEWEHELELLRTAQPAAPLGGGRPAMLSDLDLLAAQLPALSGLSAEDRKDLAASSTVTDVDAGTKIVHGGQAGGSAYYVIDGRVVSGIPKKDGSYQVLETLHPGDLFGEVPAHSHVHRKADLVAADATKLLRLPASKLRHVVPATHLRDLLRARFHHSAERIHLGELPRLARADHHMLRELRQPDSKEGR